jgi:hypothetical protein
MSKKRRFVGPINGQKQKAVTMSKDGLTPNEAKLFEFLKAHDYENAVLLVPDVENINTVDSETGMTALHWAAAHSVMGLLNVLHERNDLNELALDDEGRSASDLAWAVAEDEELGASLISRENEYARRNKNTQWPKPGSR